MNNFIILLGQRVRSGTNFVGTTLAQHPDLVTVPRNMSLGEFNLFYDDSLLTRVYNKVTSSSFGMHFKPEDQQMFLRYYGDAWLNLLKSKYKIEEDKTIFVKSPSVANINLWSTVFPEARIGILYRDGRDNVISSVRASNDKRSWHQSLTKIKKRINYYSGRSFVSHAKQWSVTSNEVLKIKETSQIKLFRYEELVGSRQGISDLLNHYRLSVTDEILDRCINAPVVGSSFGIADAENIKPNWTPDYDKSKFRFSGKWTHWNFFKKAMFKSIAGKELINLGFEKDSSW